MFHDADTVSDSDPAPTPFFASPGKALASFQEIFLPSGDAGASGFALAQIASRDASLLWVQERTALRQSGRPFLHGLPSPLPHGFIHVAARNARQALWAMEEGLKCPSLSAVIGEIHGDPRALDFTATRRLAVAAERYGIPAFLLRINGSADLSGARRRWRVESRPSLVHALDDRAPGQPVWSLDLFRARDMQPGQWDASYDAAAHRLDLVPAAGDGSVAEGTQRYG